MRITTCSWKCSAPINLAAAVCLIFAAASCVADDAPAGGEEKPKKVLSADPPGMVRLMPDYDVWIDKKYKRVVVDGTVALREGQLEMLACLKGTKEHESVISVDTKAMVVHAALLSLGAKAGSPVKYHPKYEPAKGTTIDIQIVWADDKKVVHKDRAQDWIRNVKTGKPLEYSWVFAGSGFWKDDATGQEQYQAEGGDFICVSNFPTAMLDLPVESSQGNSALLFEAFTEHVPPRGTRVRLVLTPRLDTK